MLRSYSGEHVRLMHFENFHWVRNYFRIKQLGGRGGRKRWWCWGGAQHCKPELRPDWGGLHSRLDRTCRNEKFPRDVGCLHMAGSLAEASGADKQHGEKWNPRWQGQEPVSGQGSGGSGDSTHHGIAKVWKGDATVVATVSALEPGHQPQFYTDFNNRNYKGLKRWLSG